MKKLVCCFVASFFKNTEKQRRSTVLDPHEKLEVLMAGDDESYIQVEIKGDAIEIRYAQMSGFHGQLVVEPVTSNVLRVGVVKS